MEGGVDSSLIVVLASKQSQVEDRDDAKAL